jgi:hypothetical protein
LYGTGTVRGKRFFRAEEWMAEKLRLHQAAGLQDVPAKKNRQPCFDDGMAYDTVTVINPFR